MVALEIVICLACIPVMLALTRDIELRNGRWIRVAFTLPLLFVILDSFRFALHWGASVQEGARGVGKFLVIAVCLILLALVWKGVVAHHLAGGIVRMIFGGVHHTRGFRVDLQYAKRAFRDEEFDEALTLVKEELEKDGGNFEAVMLLANICEKLKRPGDAAPYLDAVLNSPDATDEQMKQAQERKLYLERAARLHSLIR